VAVNSIVSDAVDCDGSGDVIPPHRLGQPGLERRGSRRQPAAVQEDMLIDLDASSGDGEGRARQSTAGRQRQAPTIAATLSGIASCSLERTESEPGQRQHAG
jgi:hypothetical protein